MPVKTWEPPPRQQDREPQPNEATAAESRNFDRPVRAIDANEDGPPPDELTPFDDVEINTEGSER